MSPESLTFAIRMALMCLVAMSLLPRLQSRLHTMIEQGLGSPADDPPWRQVMEAAPPSRQRPIPEVRIPLALSRQLVKAMPIDPRTVPSMQFVRRDPAS